MTKPLENPDAESTGLFLRRHVSSGFHMLDVVAMVRRPKDSFPTNPSSYSYDEKSLSLDGLMIHGYLSDSYVEFYKEVCYRNVYQIDSRTAERMSRTLKRIDSFVTKYEAREPGDVLIAFAKAIGASWIAIPRDERDWSSYSHTVWRYESITYARDLYRQKIAEMLANHPKAIKQKESA